MKKFNLKTAKYLAEILYGKKASDILILNVRRFTMAAEYFVIATANSQVHRRTLIDELLKKGKGAGRFPCFSRIKTFAD
jgi:ribosomal silencing factor RsfS